MKIIQQQSLISVKLHIFDYNFKSACDKRSKLTRIFLPKIERFELNNSNLSFKQPESLEFKFGGATILRNSRIHSFISYFPQGQNGKGGHNHIDFGSFTLSVDGIQILGVGSYS